jgi:hypothetical protein
MRHPLNEVPFDRTCLTKVPGTFGRSCHAKLWRDFFSCNSMNWLLAASGELRV